MKSKWLISIVILITTLSFSEKLVDINVSDTNSYILVTLTFDKTPAFKTEEDLSKTIFSLVFPNLRLSYMYLPVHIGALESIRFINLGNETYITFYTLIPLKPEVTAKRSSVLVKFKRNSKRINLSFESDMSLAEVIKYLSEYINLNVVVSNEVSNINVPSIKLHNVSPEDAFRTILISVPGVAYSYFPDGTLYIGKAGRDIAEKFNKFWGIYKVPSLLTSSWPSAAKSEMKMTAKIGASQSLEKSTQYLLETHPGAVVEYLKRKSVILVYGGSTIHSKIVELLNGESGYETVRVKNPLEASRILSEMFNASVTYLEPDKVVLKGDSDTISKMKDVLNRLGLAGRNKKEENRYKTLDVDVPEGSRESFQEVLKEIADFVKLTTNSKKLSIVYYPSLKKVVVISDSRESLESAFNMLKKFYDKHKRIQKKIEKSTKPEKKKIEETKEVKKEEVSSEKKEGNLYMESIELSKKIEPKVIDEIRDYVSKDEGTAVTVFYYPNIGKMLIKSPTLSSIKKVKAILNAYIGREATPSTNMKVQKALTIQNFSETQTSTKTAESATMLIYDVYSGFSYDEYIKLVKEIYPELKVFPLKSIKKVVFIGDKEMIRKAVDISHLFRKEKCKIKVMSYFSEFPIEAVLKNLKSRFSTLEITVIPSKNYLIASGDEEEIKVLEGIITDLETQLSGITPFSTQATAVETIPATSVKSIVSVSTKGRISINAFGVTLGDVVKEVFKSIGKSIIFVIYPTEKVYLKVSDVTLDRFKRILELYDYTLTSMDKTYILDKKKGSSEDKAVKKAKEGISKEKKLLVFDISHNFKKVQEFVNYFGGKVFIDEKSGLSIITGIEDEAALKVITGYMNKISTAPKQIEIEVKLVDRILSKNDSITATTNLGVPMHGGNISINPSGLSLSTDILDASQYENYLEGLLNSKINVSYAPGRSLGNSKVLAAPKVIAASGEKASIFIGDKEIYVLPSGTPLTQNYGVELTITPTYRPDDTIKLDINVKVSNSAPTTSKQGQVPLASERSREANTKVVIKDGQTIVIGGLMREITEKTENKLPFLGDLPIIGSLFRSITETTEKRNLTIFITAGVVRAW